MRMKKIQEGLGDMAHRAEMDHEVQMARSDLYKIAKYAIQLHDMLKTVSEAEGIEGWQQAKITKAADYMSSVFHSLDYDMKFGDGGSMMQQMSTESANYKETLSKKLAEKSNSTICPDCGNPSWRTLPQEAIEEAKNNAGKEQGSDGKACWKGYKFAGTENGKDKCVPSGK